MAPGAWVGSESRPYLSGGRAGPLARTGSDLPKIPVSVPETRPYHFRAAKRGAGAPLSTTTMKEWSDLLRLAAAGDVEQNQTAKCHEGVGGGFGYY